MIKGQSKAAQIDNLYHIVKQSHTNDTMNLRLACCTQNLVLTRKSRPGHHVMPGYLMSYIRWTQILTPNPGL